MKRRPKYLWAVDAMAEDRATQLTTYRALRKIASAADGVIEPVCVLNYEHIKVPKAAFDGRNKEYRLDAETRLDGFLKRLKSPRLLRPMLLMAKGPSISSSVDKLLEYARESQTPLIGIGTTTRKGLERFFIGSFAETMTLKSEIPLLVVNARTSPAANMRRMVFATDFSDASRSAFDSFLREAKMLGAKVIVYTKCEYIVPMAGTPLFGAALNYVDYVKLDSDARKETGRAWIEKAEQAGVDAKLIVDTTLGTTSETILKAATREKAGLVALGSCSGPTAAAMLGSVARSLVRRSTIPVWVIHPKPEVVSKTAASPRRAAS